MVDRIQLILKTRGISPSQLADEIGIQRSGLSHILTGRNKPSLDFVLKILNRYTEINPEWLLTGKGSMLKQEGSQDKQNSKPSLAEAPSGQIDFPELPDNKNKSVSPVNFPSQNKSTRTKQTSVYEQKKVVRVILFYSDNTFGEYQPE